MLAKCDSCGGEFIPERVKYCSVRCRMREYQRRKAAKKIKGLVQESVIKASEKTFNAELCVNHKTFKGICGCQ